MKTRIKKLIPALSCLALLSATSGCVVYPMKRIEINYNPLTGGGTVRITYVQVQSTEKILSSANKDWLSISESKADTIEELSQVVGVSNIQVRCLREALPTTCYSTFSFTDLTRVFPKHPRSRFYITRSLPNRYFAIFDDFNGSQIEVIVRVTSGRIQGFLGDRPYGIPSTSLLWRGRGVIPFFFQVLPN